MNVSFNTTSVQQAPSRDASLTVVHNSRSQSTTYASMESAPTAGVERPVKRAFSLKKETVKLPFKISQAKKDKGERCCAIACDNNPADHKGGLCHKHYARKRRALHPMETRYRQFKHNALARGHAFTITYNEFKDFCKDTGYLLVKGRRGMNATIDRIKNNHGYHIWNIQLLTLRANVNKWHQNDKHQDDANYCPF